MVAQWERVWAPVAQHLATQSKGREFKPREGQLSLHLLDQLEWVPTNRWVIIRGSAGTSVLSQPWDWPTQAALGLHHETSHTLWSRAHVSAQCSSLRRENMIIILLLMYLRMIYIFPIHFPYALVMYKACVLESDIQMYMVNEIRTSSPCILCDLQFHFTGLK